MNWLLAVLFLLVAVGGGVAAAIWQAKRGCSGGGCGGCGGQGGCGGDHH